MSDWFSQPRVKVSLFFEFLDGSIRPVSWICYRCGVGLAGRQMRVKYKNLLFIVRVALGVEVATRDA